MKETREGKRERKGDRKKVTDRERKVRGWRKSKKDVNINKKVVVDLI